MTVVHLFRRYKRWNPVHPTIGAFWGLGIGLGCGVGWGPGFGPEAVGFVGSGCGVGFSVGVTLIGFGLGLPASGLTCLPFDTLMWSAKGASNVTRNYAIPAFVFGIKQSWEAVALQSAAFEKGVQRFCGMEVPKGRKFVNQLRMRVLRGLQDKSEHPSAQVLGKPQYGTQKVQFSKSFKWIKDSPFREYPSPSNSVEDSASKM